MSMIETDICVIGAGAGGLSVAAGAVQMGARVVLVEGGEMGGDCLNTGCVPSKALLAAAHRAHGARMGGLGVAGAAPQVDFAAVRAHVAQTIAAIAPHDSQARFEGLGVQVIRAYGQFESPRVLRAGAARIRARRFVIATGSRPLVPPIPGLDQLPYLTNETLFDLPTRPEHLLVIGGGPIGLEMAQAHHRLGSRVTVVEAGRALGRDDPELAAMLLADLRAEGVEVLEHTAAERVAPAPEGVALHTAQGTLTGSHLLVAAGRQVDLARLELGRANVTHSAQGVTVDRGLRSVSNRRVYAVGDAAGGAQFTHVAGYHAGVIARAMLFGLPAKTRADHIPWVTYTRPELAQVGLTEAEARARHGAQVQVLRQEFAGNDRALAEGRGRGMVKVMVLRGRPVGASVVGPEAGTLIATWAIAIANRHKMSTLTTAVLPYPTLAEINKRVAGAYFSPKLFDSPMVKRVVRLVQRWLP